MQIWYTMHPSCKATGQSRLLISLQSLRAALFFQETISSCYSKGALRTFNWKGILKSWLGRWNNNVNISTGDHQNEVTFELRLWLFKLGSYLFSLLVVCINIELYLKKKNQIKAQYSWLWLQQKAYNPSNPEPEREHCGWHSDTLSYPTQLLNFLVYKTIVIKLGKYWAALIRKYRALFDLCK